MSLGFLPVLYSSGPLSILKAHCQTFSENLRKFAAQGAPTAGLLIVCFVLEEGGL
jgi:hypothetical protein